MEQKVSHGLRGAVTLKGASEVHIVDAQALAWQDTAEPGLRLKPVRYDNELGHFLGLVGFAAMTRSGLHQHRGVATSFIIDGSLTDYHGSIRLHEAGINLFGATHDAMAYQTSVLVSRLEGPVLYPADRGALHGLHAGSRHGEVRNCAPEVPPEMNVPVDTLAVAQTGVPGVRRQTIFDYAGTGSAHRFVQLGFAPGTRCPAWRAGGLTEFWVRGGILWVNDRPAHANSFVVIEAGAEVRLQSPHGALLLAWAEAPEEGLQGQQTHAVRPSLFGF